MDGISCISFIILLGQPYLPYKLPNSNSGRDPPRGTELHVSGRVLILDWTGISAPAGGTIDKIRLTDLITDDKQQ